MEIFTKIFKVVNLIAEKACREIVVLAICFRKGNFHLMLQIIIKFKIKQGHALTIGTKWNKTMRHQMGLDRTVRDQKELNQIIRNQMEVDWRMKKNVKLGQQIKVISDYRIQ